MENSLVSLLIFGKISFSAQPTHVYTQLRPFCYICIPLLGALALHARGPKIEFRNDTVFQLNFTSTNPDMSLDSVTHSHQIN